MEHITGLLQLTRPRNAIGALLGCAVGYYVLAAQPNASRLTTPLLLVLILNGVATVQNDLVDVEIDRRNKRSSVLLDGTITPQVVRLFSLVLLVLACILAVFSDQPRWNVAFVLAALLLAGIYNLRPVIASRRPVASIVVLGLCTGFLPVVYGALMTGRQVAMAVLLVATSWFCQRMALNLLKDFKDVAGDAQSAKHTFLLRFGRIPTIRLSIALTVIGYGLLTIGLWWVVSPAFAVLIPIAGLNVVYRWRLLRLTKNDQLKSGFVQALILQNVFDAGVLLCLCIS